MSSYFYEDVFFGVNIQHQSVEGQLHLQCVVVRESCAKQGAVTRTLQRESNGPLAISSTIASKGNRNLIDGQFFLGQVNFNSVIRQYQSQSLLTRKLLG